MASRPLADIINAACADPTRLILGLHPQDRDGRRVLGNRVRMAMRTARRFYIDDEVTRAATRLGVQHPNILCQMLARARTPFDSIWLEWAVAPQVEEAGMPVAEDAPERTGVLIERLDENEPIYRMIQLGNSIKPNEVIVGPLAIMYHLVSPIMDIRSIPDQKLIADTTKLPEEYINITTVGSAYQNQAEDDADDLEIEQRRYYCDLLASHAAHILNPLTASYIHRVLDGKHDKEGNNLTVHGVRVTHREAMQITMQDSIKEHSGAWRFVMSLLALMNTQDYVERETFRAGRSQIVSGHVVPYLEHITVKLKLPRRIVEERMVRELVDAIPRRRHEVMGHWKQSRKRGDPHCNHPYIDVTPRRQRCPLCSHSRWWVNEHMRGTAELGFVVKDRVVTRD